VRRFAPLLLLGLLLLLVPLWGAPAEGARSADAKRGCKALIERVEPRHGIRVRSLVLVPLVARQPPKKPGARVSLGDLTWRPHDGSAERDVAIHEREPSPAETKKAPAVLPTGLVLRRDDQERLVSRPGLVPAGAPATFAAPLLPHTAKAVEKAVEKATFGPLATPAQRRLLFRRPDVKALGMLVAFEAGVAGLKPDKKGASLAEISSAPEIAKAVESARGRVAKIVGAYGGEVLGHVAFLGNRPIDIVLASSPDVYAALAAQAAPGLALSLVLWERWHGREGDEPAALSWPAFIAVTERILSSLGAGTMRRQRPRPRKGATGVTEHGSLWRVKGRAVNGGTKAVELGWLLLDGEGRPVLIEAWPEPTAPPLPPPAREPGGRGEDEDPDDRDGGALTEAYLERMLERMRERNRDRSSR